VTRILVCGGRNFGITKTERDYIFECLDNFCLQNGFVTEDHNKDAVWLPVVTVIAGAAKGVDTAAVDWAVTNWCDFVEFPADWETYGKRAGYLRNVRMLEEGKPDYVIAFQGGKGTAMMIELARKKGVSVTEFVKDLTKNA
jgi:hypothetical protein